MPTHDGLRRYIQAQYVNATQYFTEHFNSTVWEHTMPTQPPSYTGYAKAIMTEDNNTIDIIEPVRGLYELAPLLECLEYLRTKCNGNVFIAGGYARWLCSPAKDPASPDDLDIYCEDVTDIKRTLDEVSKVIGRRCGALQEYFGYRLNHNCSSYPTINIICNNITQSGLLKFHGKPEDVIKRFDFSVCRVALIDNERCICDGNFVDDETKKLLRIKYVAYPETIMARILKYVAKGYVLTSVEACKAAIMIKEMLSGHEYKQVKEFVTSHGKKSPTLNSGELYHVLVR